MPTHTGNVFLGVSKAKFTVKEDTAHIVAVESFTAPSTITISTKSGSVGLSPDAGTLSIAELTVSSIVVLHTTPAIFNIVALSDLIPDPEGGYKYTGKLGLGLNIGLDLGGSYD